MERKSDKVRRLVSEGRYKDALRIAKGFRLGITKEQSDEMTIGYECMVNPVFYQSIGMDTAETVKKAIDTIQSLYGNKN